MSWFNIKGLSFLTLKNKDLPDNFFSPGILNIDTEFMGLDFKRDRLCVVQIYHPASQKGAVILLERKIVSERFKNLQALLSSTLYLKLFHYAFGDISQLSKSFKVEIRNIICTRTMSRIVRSYQNSHSLQSLVKEITRKRLDKDLTSSYWGGAISIKQMVYAVKDVLYIHLIYVYLWRMALREDRKGIVDKMHKIIPLAVENYLEGFLTEDLLQHH